MTCDWKTREKKLLTAHRKKMHGVLVTSIRCDKCEFVTSKLLDMDNHKTLKHINGVSVTSTDFTNKDESRKRAKTSSKCNSCDSTFDSDQKLKIHTADQHYDEQIIKQRFI